jgi:hypothetical protein
MGEGTIAPPVRSVYFGLVSRLHLRVVPLQSGGSVQARRMTLHGWLLIAVFVLAVGVTIRPLGAYMAWIFTGQCASNRFLRFFERSLFSPDQCSRVNKTGSTTP